MTSDRIKEIQQTTAYPDSVSVQQALLQVWNECSHPSATTEFHTGGYCPTCLLAKVHCKCALNKIAFDYIKVMKEMEIPTPEVGSNHLLPCPFCGSTPEWINLAHPSGIPALQCSECQFSMQQDRRDKTIYYWNRRTKATPEVGKIEFVEDGELYAKADNSTPTRDEVNEDRPRDLYKKPEGKSMTQVLMENGIDIFGLNDDFNSHLEKAMSEWAAIQCEARDKTIDFLEKEITEKHKEIKELREALREFAMRENIFFPETENDLKWFESGNIGNEDLRNLFRRVGVLLNLGYDDTHSGKLDSNPKAFK